MKKGLISIGIILGIVSILVLCYFKFRFKLEITLVNNITIPFGKEVNLKDYIIESNGNFIDTLYTPYELGVQKVKMEYYDKYNKRREYNFDVNIIDDENPIILSNASISTYKGEEINLLKNVICADYASNDIKCEVEGDYDFNEIGEYKLKYVATDPYDNKTYKDFILYVKEKPKYTPKPVETEPNYIYFSDVLEEHKNENTLVGIDISRFNGDINFEEVRDAGCEFVIIRLGWFIDNELGLDYKYKEYIEAAHDAGLKIGLYFYSEATTIEDVEKTVDFIINNIPYKIDMPIAYDWEDFNDYNSYNISLYNFNNLAHTFINMINENGYKGILYGSKYYLLNIWDVKDYPVWLAQYYDYVTYEGDYDMWQITENGKIDGIEGTVDIDIYYLNK